NEKKKSLMALWTRSELYLGYSAFRFRKIIDSSRLKATLKLKPTDSLVIQSVEYTWHPLELALILYFCSLCIGTKHIRLLLFNEDSRMWTLQEFELEVPMNSNLASHFLYSALPDLILWDAQRVYYSYRNFTVNGIIDIKKIDTSPPWYASHSKIHNVIV
ncbi:cation channel sperm-associated subunit epsilon, partial [Sigmodon hispidus]